MSLKRCLGDDGRRLFTLEEKNSVAGSGSSLHPWRFMTVTLAAGMWELSTGQEMTCCQPKVPVGSLHGDKVTYRYVD